MDYGWQSKSSSYPHAMLFGYEANHRMNNSQGEMILAIPRIASGTAFSIDLFSFSFYTIDNLFSIIRICIHFVHIRKSTFNLLTNVKPITLESCHSETPRFLSLF